MDLKIIAKFMIVYHEKKNAKPEPISHEKKEKTKIIAKKKDKFTKKWFIENFDNLNIKDFLIRHGDENLPPKNIYSKYLVEKKIKLNGQKILVEPELFEIVYNAYIDSIKPKRIAVLD